MEQVEGRVLGGRGALVGRGVLLAAEPDLLPQEGKVRVVRGHAQHHEVGVEAVEAVADVGIVSRAGLLVTYVVHDLVLSLARRLVPGEHHAHPLPQGVGGDLVGDEVLQLRMEANHEPVKKTLTRDPVVMLSSLRTAFRE